MNPKQAREIVQGIFDPMPLDAFLDESLGKKFFKLEGKGNCGARADLLGADPARTILKDFDRLAPKITSHAAAPLGPPPRAERARDEEAFRAKVAAFHALGYTVRVPEVQTLTPQLERFIRALEFLFHQPVAAAAFWSRGDAKAPIHHDNYDLIVVQIVGRKKWFISVDPPGLPNDWSVIPDGPARLGRYTEVNVEPGDLLYLPRGTVHRVDAVADSIHVSIGFVPLTLREAIAACLDALSDMDKPLREMVGGRIAEQLVRADFGDTPGRIRDGIAALAKACADDAFIAEALQQRSSRVIGGLPKLTSVMETPTLSPSDRVRHTPLAVSHLSGNQRLIDFAYPGGHHYIHRGAEESVTFVAQTPEFRISEIPGAIADDVRVALVEKLMASGFLEIVAN